MDFCTFPQESSGVEKSSFGHHFDDCMKSSIIFFGFYYEVQQHTGTLQTLPFKH